MRIGITLRNMGHQSTAAIMAAGAQAADAAGLDSIWITDHLAIPPDDAEGSGGRYTDPLVTLGWLAAKTENIRVGSGVLILPYRPALPTAKAVATVQELSGGRLVLGVGAGWMEPEFRALGVPRGQRGRRTDETLAFLRECFENEVVERNGQAFLFKPRPPAPPILVGGHSERALQRTIRFGDGWLPMGTNPEKLVGPIERLATIAEEVGKPAPEVIAMGPLPLADAAAARERLAALAEIGVGEVVCGGRYESLQEYLQLVEQVAALRSSAG